MHRFFNPQSIAVIGVPARTGDGSFNNVETMVRYGYKGKVYPVNPKATEIYGRKAYPSVLDIPETADLAIISVGRDRVFPLFEECVRTGIKRVVIISQGFADADQRGKELQDQIVNLARENGVRIVGPNTMGLLNNYARFTTGFVDLPVPERFSPVSLIAQTGYIQVASVDHAYRSWGKAVDIGNSCDIHFVDALEYFADDPETKVIAVHMEGMKRGAKFLEIASKVTVKKPIVVLKTGRTGAGAKAALSHTGSLVGEDSVFDAAFDRTGIIRVRDTADWRLAIKALICFDEMAGPRVGIVTVTGAGGIMAIDACERQGLALAELPAGLSETLREGMPEWIHVGNPIDIWPIGMIGGDYPGAVGRALTGLLQSPDVDGAVLIIPAMNSPLHQNMADLSPVVAEARRKTGNRKPVAAFLYADEHKEFPDRYEALDGVASFDSPEECVRGLAVAYKNYQGRNRRGRSPKQYPIDTTAVETLAGEGRREGALLGDSAFLLLEVFGIPCVKSRYSGGTWDELEQAAAGLAWPVVLKLAGSPFLHKSEWGGVITGIRDIDALKAAWETMTQSVRRRDPSVKIETFQLQEQASGKELLLGLKWDPQFGHVIACGMGGIYTEVYRDISRAIVPIDGIDAETMLRELTMFPILTGVRGEKAVDMESLVDILERLSFLAATIPDLSELDVNPLIVSDQGCRAVDARILW
ncbi:MAG: acetate--CoA ligase family protein [Deltaproteobacteria bacterium]|nr:acetate--CoA ligase family protein [Deltaproteobacteria bacterium]MBN2686722.1 acetate--CoA ligase family protein [Deltaproteobacteria bacterium]